MNHMTIWNSVEKSIGGQVKQRKVILICLESSAKQFLPKIVSAALEALKCCQTVLEPYKDSLTYCRRPRGQKAKITQFQNQ